MIFEKNLLAGPTCFIKAHKNSSVGPNIYSKRKSKIGGNEFKSFREGSLDPDNKSAGESQTSLNLHIPSKINSSVDPYAERDSSARGGGGGGEVQQPSQPVIINGCLMHYQYLFGIQYMYRMKTEALYQDRGKEHIFEVYLLDDPKFSEFHLFKNIWRETLLLNKLEDPRIAKVHSFGQLPNSFIYREIEEIRGITLEEHLKQIEAKQQIQEAEDEDDDSPRP